MLSLDDPRWTEMKGGYRVPFDPRLFIRNIENGIDTKASWGSLWDELHHQGDVDEASFAAIPQLVMLLGIQDQALWDTFALTSIIELARGNNGNPDVPEWLAAEYFESIRMLAEIGASAIQKITDAETVRAILSVIAISKGLRNCGRFIIQYSEEELAEIEKSIWSRRLTT